MVGAPVPVRAGRERFTVDIGLPGQHWGDAGNRGFESYALVDPDGDRVRTRDWRWLNPQTQEAWQVPRGSR